MTQRYASLLEIEQAVEIKAREWQRQQLQKRLQQAADQQGKICPDSASRCKRPGYEM